MNGLWRPVGPQSAATYWLRRALVLGVLAAVIALVVALVTPSPKRQGVPSAAPSSVLGTAITASPSSATRSTASSTPEASNAPAAKGAKAAKAKTSAAKPPAKAPAQEPVKCAPSRLRVSLDGPGQLQAGQPTTFALAVTNSSSARCMVRVTGDTFELRIYSGSDRIWSSADCATALRSVTKQLDAGQAVRWQLKWSGRRSAAKCQSRPEVPRPGTYITTAELSGVRSVQVRTILRG